jgi:hypothetical protein
MSQANVALRGQSINSNLRLSHEAIGATLEALVGLLQSYLNALQTNAVPSMTLSLIPPVFVALKPILARQWRRTAVALSQQSVRATWKDARSVRHEVEISTLERRDRTIYIFVFTVNTGFTPSYQESQTT